MILNWIAILVSSIAVFVVGMLWYSPILFKDQWMKLSGISEKEMKKCKKDGMQKQMIVAFLSNVVLVVVLAQMLNLTGAVGISAAVTVGFWIWLGFIATVSLGSVLWEKKPVQLYLINIGQTLASVLVAAIILAAWV
ncbi:DUF1761 domain-containing protein [archaeon]|nr:DUF1761 domain-containing protein [archaeon]